MHIVIMTLSTNLHSEEAIERFRQWVVLQGTAFRHSTWKLLLWCGEDLSCSAARVQRPTSQTGKRWQNRVALAPDAYPLCSDRLNTGHA